MAVNQLFLLVLSTLMTGVAIVIGFDLASSSADTSVKDGLVLEFQHVAGAARSFYRKPRALGGGGRSFTGFRFPMSVRKSELGKYKMVKVEPDLVHFRVVGYATGKDGDPLRLDVKISIDDITITTGGDSVEEGDEGSVDLGNESS